MGTAYVSPLTVVECTACYEEFGSRACLRAAHKPGYWTALGEVSSTTVTYADFWPPTKKMFYEEDPWINREE